MESGSILSLALLICQFSTTFKGAVCKRIWSENTAETFVCSCLSAFSKTFLHHVFMLRFKVEIV